MTGQRWKRKILNLLVAALTCAVVVVSITWAYPTQVASPTLGADWQCHRAVVLTTCSRVSHVVPMITRAPARALDLRRV